MSESSWWRKAIMLVAVLLLMMMVVVEGNAQLEKRNTDPVFNIWEFAIANNYNPRRQTSQVKDPCTWAIVNCCMVTNRGERDECFSNNGCSGAWFNNLCSKKFKGLARGVIQDAFAGGF